LIDSADDYFGGGGFRYQGCRSFTINNKVYFAEWGKRRKEGTPEKSYSWSLGRGIAKGYELLDMKGRELKAVQGDIPNVAYPRPLIKPAGQTGSLRKAAAV